MGGQTSRQQHQQPPAVAKVKRGSSSPRSFTMSGETPAEAVNKLVTSGTLGGTTPELEFDDQLTPRIIMDGQVYPVTLSRDVNDSRKHYAHVTVMVK